MLEFFLWLMAIAFWISIFLGLVCAFLAIILISFQFIVIFLRPFFWIWFKITGNRRIWDTLDSMADRAGYHANAMIDFSIGVLNSFADKENDDHL